MRIGVNNSSWPLESDKEAEGGEVGDSGEKGIFGTTNLQCEFRLSPYQSGKEKQAHPMPLRVSRASRPACKKEEQTGP